MNKSSENDLSTQLIVPLNTSDAYPLFCFHPVGGQVVFYKALAKRMSQRYHVYGIRAVGLYGEAQPLDSVETMANTYLPEIQKIQPKGPYLLVGWSMGGLIAFEIARILSQRKETAIPILIDTDDPSQAIRVKNLDKETIFRHLNEMQAIGVNYVGKDMVSWRVKASLFLLDLIGLAFQKTSFLMPIFGVKSYGIDFKHFDKYLDMIVHDISTREATQFPISQFVSFLKNNHLISDTVNDHLLHSFYEVFRANFYAAENYLPGNFNGTGFYFKASKRKFPIYWQNKITTYDEIIYKGSHYSVLKTPKSVKKIANKLLSLPYGQ